MTISARRKTYWILFAVALAMLAVFIFLFFGVIDRSVSAGFLVRSDAYGLFGKGPGALPSYVLAAAGTGILAFASVLTLSFILASFRKTVSAEIFFFSFWIVSLSFEVIRVLIFLLAARGRPDSVQLLATKILLAARYAGTLSLFMSGVYAAGFRNEKFGINTMLILAAAIGLSAVMPVNTGIYLFTLELKPGYASVNGWFFFIVGIMSTLNFLTAIHVRSEKTFAFVALGCAASIIGVRFLTSSWNPWYMALGFVLVCSGSWLFVSRLHEYYLWQ